MLTVDAFTVLVIFMCGTAFGAALVIAAARAHSRNTRRDDG
jgi:hypothetical protein